MKPLDRKINLFYIEFYSINRRETETEREGEYSLERILLFHSCQSFYASLTREYSTAAECSERVLVE